MSNVIIDDKRLSDIADAIRALNGSNEQYTPAEMPDAISSLSVAPDGNFIESETVGHIFTSTSNPTSSDGENGDMWFVYKV